MSEDAKTSVVDILVTSSVNTFGTQKHFPLSIQIGELKKKLELITGASAETMEIWILDDKNELLYKLTDDNSTLSSYDLTKAKNLHVVDAFLQAGEFEDLSKVKKFELSDEEYKKREDSFRAFKEKLKIEGHNDDKENVKEKKLKAEQELIKNINVGNRCEVRVSGKSNRRGTVMYVGKTEFKEGYWVGIKYDEPLGKNDGSVAGKIYFECQPNYGSFVKPQDVTVGDFPEEISELDEL